MNQSIETLLVQSQLIITKVKSNANLALALSSMGYNEEALSKGKLLIANARKIQQGYQDDLFDKIDDANYVFRRHVKLSRIVFIEQESAWERLDLNSSWQFSPQEWIVKAKVFYQTLINNNDYLSSLVPFGIDKIMLENTLSHLMRLENKITKLNKTSPDIIHRDQAIDDLNIWMEEFENAARKAFRKSSEELNSLGVY